MAQTVQNGGLGASFGHPKRVNEASGDTLGPQNREGGLWGIILSAQGPHNEIFGLVLGVKWGSLASFWGQRPQNGALLDHFWGTKGPMVATKSTPEEK